MPKLKRSKQAILVLRHSSSRLKALEDILGRLCPVPQEWLSDAATASKDHTTPKGGNLVCLPCESYRELTMAWRKALKWTDGLDHGLVSMLASISSVQCLGDQLWMKVIGVASCGKSVLCEAVSLSNHVVAKSTIRGFHSGYKTEGGNKDEDNSLISQLYDKTLVTKDGDTLLQSPNLQQILAEARDIYDGTGRTHYRNAMSKDYHGIRMTWLLCGTSSLRSIDQSELGERFLDCVIMEKIDDELEDEILWRVVNRSEKSVGVVSDDDLESQYELEMAEAMKLTGGYVDYLRENAGTEIAKIKTPTEALRKIMRMGKFVACLRARPSMKQEETAEREFGTRLTSQLVRLAKCLAFVLNKGVVDKEVMKRVQQIALDTGRGQTLEMVKWLYHKGPKGMEAQTLGLKVGKAGDKIRGLLRFMYQINIVESYTPEVEGVTQKVRWKLTESMDNLYRDVLTTNS